MTNPISFEAPIILWRGPAPFFFAALPTDLGDEVRAAARRASYGWGCVPVSARINDIDFTTSLIPKDGTYLLPLKADVRRRARLDLGSTVSATVTI